MTIDTLHAWLEASARAHGSTLYHALWLGGALVWLAGSTWIAVRDGLPRKRVAVVLGVLVPVVFFGARLHMLLFETRTPLAYLWEHPAILWSPGYRLPGGLLLALVTAPLLCRMAGVSFPALADAAAPLVGVGLAIGRLGCLIQGCCFGSVSHLPWAMAAGPDSPTYANHMARSLLPAGANASLPVHPLALYLVTAGLAASAVLFWLRRQRPMPGEVGLALVALLGGALGMFESLRETALVPPVPFRQALLLVVAGLGAIAWASVRLAAAPRAGLVHRLSTSEAARRP